MTRGGATDAPPKTSRKSAKKEETKPEESSTTRLVLVINYKKLTIHRSASPLIDINKIKQVCWVIPIPVGMSLAPHH